MLNQHYYEMWCKRKFGNYIDVKIFGSSSYHAYMHSSDDDNEWRKFSVLENCHH